MAGLTRRLASRFGRLTNLADARLGARVLFASDEWFAVGSNLLQPTEPLWDSETFCTQGKVMDGWESRRRRAAGHDWALIRLGLPGYVLGVEIDTAHFTGNQAPAARVLAATIDDTADAWLGAARPDLGVRGSAASPQQMAAAESACAAAAQWVELVPATALRPGEIGLRVLF
jgi:allantoicase